MKTRAIIIKISLIAVFLFFINGASAEESAVASPTPGQDQIIGALKDLSLAVGHTVTTTKEAHDLCNQEQYLMICAEIGKKHKLYTAERVKQVDIVLEQLKGKIIEQLKGCKTRECLVEVANALSKRLTASNPTTAEKLNLTTKKIEEHKTALEKAKQTDAESAQRMTDFRAALASGSITCGDNTVGGCTKFCLKSPTILPVCREIAQKYFGPGALERLEKTHQVPRPLPQPIQKPASNSPGLIFHLFDALLR